MSKRVNLIVAATPTYGIGNQGALPFRLKGDMSYFKAITCNVDRHMYSDKHFNCVIMGRNTWDSLPAKFRPLPDRVNCIVSKSLFAQLPSNNTLVCKKTGVELRTMEQGDSRVVVSASLEGALAAMPEREDVAELFLIGGSSIYEASLSMPGVVSRVYLTRVGKDVQCDTFCKKLGDVVNGSLGFSLTKLSPTHVEGDVNYDYAVFEQVSEKEVSARRQKQQSAAQFAALASHSNASSIEGRQLVPAESLALEWKGHEEYQYLDLLRDIIENGNDKGDRTGTGTYSKFGVSMRYDLSKNQFPLFTTKKTFVRAIIEELFWFVRGDTSQPRLAAKNVHIWDANASREFLDARGLSHYPDGDLGPVYGFQWRRFGCEYKGCDFDYDSLPCEKRGIDQLAECINLIKKDPNSRRIVLTAWNPTDINKMALPPCHMFCQFYVHDNKLSCSLYQRSGDLGLGVPFNVASYSLLVAMMAQICGLQRGEFVHFIGDAHVYKNHVEPLKAQINRTPFPFPILELNPEVTDVTKFEYKDVIIKNYQSHAKVDMAMAV